MTDAIQARLPIQLVYAIGHLIAANRDHHDTSRGPLGKVCVRRVDNATVQLSGTDGHALMSAEVSCSHNLPEGQTFVVDEVPPRAPRVSLHKVPFLPPLSRWEASVDPCLLEKSLSRFEADGRPGAFDPRLGEACMRALRHCGVGFVEIACNREVTRFTTANRWGPTQVVLLLAGVRLSCHTEEDAET